jgi:ADP-ribosylglycohydrolase
MAVPDAARRVSAARRSLDGLSVGDALGETFFLHTATLRQRIEARVLPAGPARWTDDTAMALSIVDVLERFGRIEQDELARLFGKRFAKEPHRGYGGGAFSILDKLDRGMDWRTVSAAAFGGTGSMGNGAAMRAAPIGAFFSDNIGLAAENARLSAEVTHAHVEGRAGAIAVAVAAAHLAGGGAADRLFPEVLEHVPASLTRTGIEEASRLRRATGPVVAAARLGSGARVLSQDTVPFCLWCAARSGVDFEDAFWTTVAGLGDRDTTCAIVCGIIAAQPLVTVPAAWLALREPLPGRSP